MVCPDRCLYRAELLLQLLAPDGRGRGRGTYSVPTQFCLMRKFPQHLHSFKSEGSQLFSRTFSQKLQLLPLRRSRGHCLAPYKVIMRWSVAHGSSGNARVWNRERRRRNRQQMWAWSDNRLVAAASMPPLRISRIRSGSSPLQGTLWP